MRRHTLITYDITDDRRLRKVQKAVSDVAEQVQYSVYYGQFSAKDLVVLKARLKPLMNAAQDQVLFLDLGRVDAGETGPSELGITGLGVPWKPPQASRLIY